jgi:hypothetical protein
MSEFDLAVVWPLIAGVVICGIAAAMLIVGLQRLRADGTQSAATGDPVRRSTTAPSRGAIIARFVALDAIGMALLLWGVLRLVGMA